MENKDLTELERTYETLAIKMGFIVFKTEGLAQLWVEEKEADSKTKNIMVINWRNTEGIEQFLKTASAMNASVLYLDAVRFSWNDLSNKIDNLCLSDEEMSKRHKDAQEFKRFDSLTGHLILAFNFNNIWHTFQKTTDWLPRYLRLLVESEDFEEEEEEEEVLEEEDLEKYARKLANDPGFEKLKNKSDQIALARKVFYKEDEKVLYCLKEIVERARVIFQTEVK